MPAAAITQAGAGTTHVLSGVTGKIIRLLGLVGAIGTTGTVILKSSGGTALTGTINVAAGQPLVIPESREGWGETVSGEGLDVISATGAFNGVLIYQLIPG